MPVRLRLQRHGRKQRPFYYIVAADARARRDGKYIERLGSYDPTTIPATIKVDDDAALAWLEKGAEPTKTVRAILSYHGVLYRKHLHRGVKKGAFSQEEADKMYNDWVHQRKLDIESHVESVSRNSEDLKKQREAAEAKKRADKAAAMAAAAQAETEAAEAEAAEAEATEATETAETEAPAEAPATEETAEAPAEETAETEAPAEETAEAPAEEEKPAEETAEAPTEEETPAEETAEAPAEEETPAEETAEAPAEEEKPAEETAEAPAEDEDKKEEA